MSVVDRLQFYLMHFMPYPDVVPGRPQSQWVDIPNTHFDPEKGHKLYKEYLDELVLGDELGYDGLVVKEHHSTFYSLMPSCSVIAGALIARTRQARICVFGTPITLTYPHRLAEEYAMLDVMSGGRLECAFPLGTGMEYWVNPLNPTNVRESMDVLTWRGPSRAQRASTASSTTTNISIRFRCPTRSRIRSSTSSVRVRKILCSTRPRRGMAIRRSSRRCRPAQVIRELSQHRQCRHLFLMRSWWWSRVVTPST
jgi:hypothetical protein